MLFATANRQETGSGATVLIPRFYEHEGSGALIGEDFLGQLENFRISRTARNTFLTEAYVNSGWIISPVFDSGAGGTPLTSFFYDVIIPQQSSMEFQLRTSDNNFTALSMDYPWHTYQNGQQVLLRGRYWQWRARLTMSPDGTASPRLSAVQLDLKADLAPEPPTGLTATPGNRFVHLTWHFNTENDADGYKVYYSTVDTEPQLYTDAGNKNRITVAPLNNGTTYYFWVTAYDSENPPHESTFSLPVSAAPNP